MPGMPDPQRRPAFKLPHPMTRTVTVGHAVAAFLERRSVKVAFGVISRLPRH